MDTLRTYLELNLKARVIRVLRLRLWRIFDSLSTVIRRAGSHPCVDNSNLGERYVKFKNLLVVAMEAWSTRTGSDFFTLIYRALRAHPTIIAPAGSTCRLRPSLHLLLKGR